MHPRIALLVAAAALASAGRPASADLIFRFENTQLVEGQGGVVDVFIRSDAGTITLDSYNVRFLISPIATSSELQFADAALQPDVQADPAYLLNAPGVSSAKGAPVVDTISTTAIPGDTYTGSDFVDFFAGQSVGLGATERLFARLLLVPTAGAGPVAGDQFELRIVASATEFYEFFSPVAAPLSDVTQTLTIVPATVIPEPSSLAMIGLGLGGAALVGLRRARSATGRTDSPS